MGKNAADLARKRVSNKYDSYLERDGSLVCIVQLEMSARVKGCEAETRIPIAAAQVAKLTPRALDVAANVLSLHVYRIRRKIQAKLV